MKSAKRILPFSLLPFSFSLMFVGCVRGFSRKTPGKSKETCWISFPESQNARKKQDFGHRELQTCREPGVDIALDLVPAFCAGCFFESDSYSLLRFY